MIPEAAVEAAARAMLDKMYDDKTLRVDDEDRDIARAALEAAAPHMLRDAWESGYTLGYADCANKQESNRPNPHS